MNKNSKLIYVLLAIAILLLIALVVLAALIFVNTNDDSSETPVSTDNPNRDFCPKDAKRWQDMACCRETCKRQYNKRPLLLISMDGFRADYLKRHKTPAIQQMIDCGSHAPYMFPSYISVTFPNHYAIVTGLYPESHGIIDNEMYDPTITNKSNRYFDISDPSALDPQWWLGEPFWNTVVKDNKVAGTYFWPGSDVQIQGMYPTYWLPYDGSVPFYQRVDTVINWLLLNETERPDFITLYFDEPDHTGHDYGPDSGQVTNELIVIDSFINYLMDQLYINNLLNCLDIIMVADHGMETVNETVFMNASLYFNASLNTMDVFSGPVGRVQVETSNYTQQQIFDDLICKNDFSRVYKRQEVPRRLHYSVTPRIGEVVIDMDDGYMFEKKYAPDLLGEHGYDFKYFPMHALFVAYGPSFKQNFEMTPFQNIELYNLFADLVQISPNKRAPTNGTHGVLNPILLNPTPISPPTYQNLPKCTFESAPTGACGDCSFMINQCPNTFSAIGVQPLIATSTVCSSNQCDYVLLYYANLSMPVAVQAQITAKSVMTTADQLGCTIVANTTTCSSISQHEQTLKSIGASMYSVFSFDAATTSAATSWYAEAPMYDGFYSGTWAWTQNLTLRYAQKFGSVTLFSGAIFDYDFNGVADPLDVIMKNTINGIVLPTHFYQILLRCNGTWNTDRTCNGVPLVLSFILPNTQTEKNYCQSPEKFLYKNTGRVRDIELLTGVEFFTNWDFDIAVQLRVHINDELWDDSLTHF